MSGDHAPEEPEKLIFTLRDWIVFIVATTIGLALLRLTPRFEIKIADGLILSLSAVLSSIYGLFATKPYSRERTLSILCGVIVGWILSVCLAFAIPE